MNLTLDFFLLKHIPYAIFAYGKGSRYEREQTLPSVSTSFSIGEDDVGNVFKYKKN